MKKITLLLTLLSFLISTNAFAQTCAKMFYAGITGKGIIASCHEFTTNGSCDTQEIKNIFSSEKVGGFVLGVGCPKEDTPLKTRDGFNEALKWAGGIEYKCSPSSSTISNVKILYNNNARNAGLGGPRHPSLQCIKVN